MTWYDLEKCDTDTGEGVLELTEEDEKQLQEGDEILLYCQVTGLWGEALMLGREGKEILAQWVGCGTSKEEAWHVGPLSGFLGKSLLTEKRGHVALQTKEEFR
jgi:hypothetical protein